MVALSDGPDNILLPPVPPLDGLTPEGTPGKDASPPSWQERYEPLLHRRLSAPDSISPELKDYTAPFRNSITRSRMYSAGDNFGHTPVPQPNRPSTPKSAFQSFQRAYSPSRASVQSSTPSMVQTVERQFIVPVQKRTTANGTYFAPLDSYPVHAQALQGLQRRRSLPHDLGIGGISRQPAFTPQPQVTSRVMEVTRFDPYPVKKEVVHYAEVPVDRIVEHYVDQPEYIPVPHHVPVPVVQERIVTRQVPHPVERVIHRPRHIVIPKVVEKHVAVPHEIETHETIEIPVPVEQVVYKDIPVPVEVTKVVTVPVPMENIIERPVLYPVEQVVEKVVENPVPVTVPEMVPVPVPYEEIVTRPVRIPVEKVIHKPVPFPVPEYVEKVVEVPKYIFQKQQVKVPVPVERIVYRDIPVPVEQIVERVVERDVPVPVPKHVNVPTPIHVRYPVSKIVDRPVPYPVDRVVEKPVHVPYDVPVPVPHTVTVPVETVRTVEVAVPVEEVVQQIQERVVPVPTPILRTDHYSTQVHHTQVTRKRAPPVMMAPVTTPSPMVPVPILPTPVIPATQPSPPPGSGLPATTTYPTTSLARQAKNANALQPPPNSAAAKFLQQATQTRRTGRSPVPKPGNSSRGRSTGSQASVPTAPSSPEGTVDTARRSTSMPR